MKLNWWNLLHFPIQYNTNKKSVLTFVRSLVPCMLLYWQTLCPILCGFGTRYEIMYTCTCSSEKDLKINLIWKRTFHQQDIKNLPQVLGSGAGCHSAECASISVQVIVVGRIALNPVSHVIVCISPLKKDDAWSERDALFGAMKGWHSGTVMRLTQESHVLTYDDWCKRACDRDQRLKDKMNSSWTISEITRISCNDKLKHGNMSGKNINYLSIKTLINYVYFSILVVIKWCKVMTQTYRGGESIQEREI